MRINLRKIFKFTLWLWIFLIPFQLYITRGASLSVSLVLSAFNTLIFSLLVFRSRVNRDSLLSTFRKNTLPILFIIFLLVSFAVNKVSSSVVLDWKELARWIIFLVQYLVVFSSLKLKYLSSKELLTALLIGIAVLTLTSIYQPFVTVEFERDTVVRLLGSLFNDPELIAEKFAGVGQFNWQYGPVIRAHGVIVNANHYSFILGIGILALRDLVFKTTKKGPLKVAPWAIALSLFMYTFMHLSLVRSTFLSLGLVVLFDIVQMIRREKVLERRIFVGSYIGGLIMAFILGLVSKDQITAFALLSRFVEWITLDGLWLHSLQNSVANIISSFSGTIAEYNEEGGVGGRLYIFKQVTEGIIWPNILNIKYLLLGFGVGSFKALFQSVSTHEYFKAFGSADNSFLFWLVEFGLGIYFFVFYYILFNIKSLWKRYSPYMHWVIFLIIELLFKNTIPDLRLSALLAVVFSYLVYTSNEKR